MAHRSMIVYDGSEGTEWRGTYPDKDKAFLKKEYKAKGYVGYLSGYRLSAEHSYGVMSFFKNKPTVAEIQRRRDNGFKAAKWNWL